MILQGLIDISVAVQLKKSRDLTDTEKYAITSFLPQTTIFHLNSMALATVVFNILGLASSMVWYIHLLMKGLTVNFVFFLVNLVTSAFPHLEF